MADAVVPVTGLKVVDAVSLFMRHCKVERDLTEHTLKAYTMDFRQFLDFVKKEGGGEMPVAEVSRNTIREYLEELHGRYKPRSIKRKAAALKSLFAFLEREDVVESSPFRKMKLNLDKSRTLPRTIEKGAVERVFKAAYKSGQGSNVSAHREREALRDVAVLEMLFATGMRVSELCALKVEDVDCRIGSVRIFGKGKRERMVPLCSKQTLAALKAYKAAYAAYLEQGEAFYRNRDGRPLSDQSVRRIVRKFQEIAGVKDRITPHMFRHTIATMLLDNGVDIRNIQTLLGHSSLLVTEIYTHVSQNSQREVLRGKHPREAMLKGMYG